ncbi:dihydrofolate reductase family protein [Microlunatus sp. GCM10028923]|uniref:dihydrofolate reductase family protein n=1 Tax=Microlunatus sp. GCM10028923 TaxID=3273400 RepID=UPI0036245857
MGRVFSHMTMSLDGFIANPEDGIDELFEWYDDGEVEVESANPDIRLSVDSASAEVLRGLIDVGALISGRRLFDLTDGWGDQHPVGAPVVVVSHSVPENAAERWPRTTFVGDVTTAVELAREIAGDGNVTIASASITQQALDLGLVDEVCVSLVPVLFGEGIPYFAKLDRGHLLLEDPIVVQGRRALHLRFAVRR